jgi:hypothetical protein
MSANTAQDALYTTYIDQSAVVLYLDDGSGYGTGRFVSSQADYQIAYGFALELAAQEGLTFINQVLGAHN